jgi:hypothetical protein
MSHRIARLVSILGHPLLTLPLAILALLSAYAPASVHATAIGIAIVAAAVMGYSRWQVKRERWAHIDASRPSERAGLNRALLVLLPVLAAVAALRDAYELALGLALSAGLILIAMALMRWCKLSLHVAFAAYAAGLLWMLSPFAGGVAFFFTAAIAWSRLHLDRHRPRDVAIGAIAGIVAALAYSISLAHLASMWWSAGG